MPQNIIGLNGKIIQWEFRKKFKLITRTSGICTTQDNDTHRILRDVEIQTDHLIPARRSDLEILNQRKQKKKNKYLDLAKEQKKKIMENENDGDTNWGCGA